MRPQALDEVKARSQKWARSVRDEHTQKQVRDKMHEPKGTEEPRSPRADVPHATRAEAVIRMVRDMSVCCT